MNSSAPARAAISIRGKDRCEWVDRERQDLDDRDQEHRDLGARRERDLGRELDLPPGRHDDCAPVLGRVADNRDDDGGDEEVGQPRGLGEGLDRSDEDLGHDGGNDRCDAEHDE